MHKNNIGVCGKFSALRVLKMLVPMTNADKTTTFDFLYITTVVLREIQATLFQPHRKRKKQQQYFIIQCLLDSSSRNNN